METVIRTTIAALVASFALCASAQAAVWTPAQTEKAIAVADAHWPASACHGRELINWVTAPAMSEFAATAYEDTCTVDIAWNEVADTDRSPGFLCTVLEHEFGHLAGLDHANSSSNVMFAVVWRVAPTAPQRSRATRSCLAPA
jgi:hypothetical protein